MGNKKAEIDCLERVIRCSKTFRGESKRILQLLTGEDVQREFDERPDFVKRYKDESGSTIIGIEHFLVDYSSIIKKNGKIAGTTTKFNQDMNSIFEDYKPYIDSNNKDMMFSAIEEIQRTLGEHYKNSLKTTYPNFIRYFKNSLEKHLKNVDVYLENLNKEANKYEKIRFALLIEIHSDFFELLINNNGKLVKKNNNATMPMFRDIVELLKTVDSSKVDYIILCCGGPLYNDKVNVYPFKTKNIEKSIFKSGTRIYEYYGEDMFFHEEFNLYTNGKMNVNVEKDDNGYNSTFTYEANTVDAELLMELGFFALMFAYYAKKRKDNFVASRYVQKWLYVINHFNVSWQSKTNENGKEYVVPVLPNADIKHIDELVNEFEYKWFSNEE